MNTKIHGDISIFLKALGKTENDTQFKKARALVEGTYETDIYTDTGVEEKYLASVDHGADFLLIDGIVSTIFFYTTKGDDHIVYSGWPDLINGVSLDSTQQEIIHTLGAPLRFTPTYLTYETKAGYIYTDKVGAGPEHPDKKWGLYSKEITPERAAIRYRLNALRRARWFGIVKEEPKGGRPEAYLQICPRANGVVLEQLNEHGSVLVSYTWGAYYEPAKQVAYEGSEDRVFLGSYTTYVYPKKKQYFRKNQAVGHITLTFNKNGDVKQDLVISHGFGKPSDVETQEYHGVDLSENWTDIPEFGNWDAFFNPPKWER